MAATRYESTLTEQYLTLHISGRVADIALEMYTTVLTRNGYKFSGFSHMERSDPDRERCRERTSSEVPASPLRLEGLTWSAFLDNLTDAFLVIDADWRIIYINAEAARINRKPREDFLGNIFWEEWPAAVGSEFERQYRRAVIERCSVHFEERYVAPGYDVWLEVRAYPLNGGLAIFYQDITERKVIEAENKRLATALERRVNELQTLMATLPIGVAISEDAACESIRINPEMARMLGVDPGLNTSKSGPHAATLPFHFMRDSVEIPASELPQQVAQREGKPVGQQELKIARDDGQEIHIYGSAVPLFDEQHRVRGSIGAFVDFTERRRHEDELRVLMERLTFHVENTPLAVIEFDSAFQIKNWSKRAEQIFGWSTDEVVGKCISDFEWVFAEDRGAVAGLSQEMASGRKMQNMHRNRNYTKSGSIVWCEWYNSALVDRDGKLASVFSLVLDVTERVKNETAFRQANEDLQAFSDMLAHDLREPLRIIQVFSQILTRESQNALGERASRCLREIDSAATRMANIIGGLLSFARASHIGTEPPQPTSAGDAVQAALANLRASIEEASAEVEVGSLGEVMAEPQHLTVIFQNLVGNAIRYRKENEAPRIRINAEIVDGECVFSVQDNGIGFYMAHADRIFQPFQRLGTRSASGSGLGLAIVKRAVERFGGRVWAESSPGVGSTFYFSLSAKQRATTR